MDPTSLLHRIENVCTNEIREMLQLHIFFNGFYTENTVVSQGLAVAKNFWQQQITGRSSSCIKFGKKICIYRIILTKEAKVG